MTLLAAYRDARRDEDVARLRRVLALRGMQAEGMSQRQIAVALGISQPAVSQQLTSAPDLAYVHPQVLVEAARPVLKELATRHGYTNLAVFGSVARGQARSDSDIDLLVDSPAETSLFDLLRFKELLERVLDRQIDLVDRGGLNPTIDADIRRESVML